MMKKLGVAILAVLITGSSSLPATNGIQGTDEMSSYGYGSLLTTNGASGETVSSPPRQATNYVLPTSYEVAYTYRTGLPDPKMKNIPQNIEANRENNPDEYIRQIVAYINENSTNDFERVKKAHDLVALLIHYDVAKLRTNTISAQDFRSVLKSKLAVCEGYSNVLKKLCDDLQIKCEIVSGFGRGVGVSPFTGDEPTNSNHAWNIVTINNENYLIDCTWNSGYMDGRTSKQEYSTDWLFLKPEQFIYTHFPENQSQQLMEKPLSSGEFSKLPFYRPKFFEIIDEISPNLLAINKVKGKLTIECTAREGLEINFGIYSENGSRQFPNNSFIQRKGDRYKAYFSFPSSENYLLRIFWKRAGDEAEYSYCGEIGIASSTGSTVKYPTQYISSGIEIISPIEMPLQRGKSYEFKVRADNKKIVALIYGKNFVQLTKGEDGVFSVEAKIPSNIKDLSIGVADSERGYYETVVQYQVD
ncbi:MAG: hypothetical protein LBQ31_03440 [Bacteroidales bacterium]|jgi:hypothetical protein|nr:hypothetical protein [Bacteroidales bacterium]